MFKRHRHLRAMLRDNPTDTGTPNPGGGGGGTGTPPAANPPAPPAETFDPAKLSPEVLAYIAKREKAADEKARTTTRDNAAQAAEAKIRDEMAIKLGIKPAEVDPAKVSAELAAAREANKLLRVEGATERAARKAGADEDLVVAKLMRDGSLRGLDPEAADFKDKVKALVDQALVDNPRLKLDTTPPPPVANGAVGSHNAPAGGEGGKARPRSLAEALQNVKL